MQDRDARVLAERYQQICEDLKDKKYYLGMKNPIIPGGVMERSPMDEIPRHNAKVEIYEILNNAKALDWDAEYAIRKWRTSDLESYLWNAGCKRSPSEIESDHEGDTDYDDYPVVKKSLFDWVMEKHPPTDDLRLAGYVLPDGTMLNLSHDGMTRGVDHREITWPESEGSTEKMISFMNAGAMRIHVTGAGAISMRVPLTPQQERVLYQISNKTNGKMMIDCEKPDASGYSYADRISIQQSHEADIDDTIKKIRRFYSRAR